MQRESVAEQRRSDKRRSDYDYFKRFLLIRVNSRLCIIHIEARQINTRIYTNKKIKPESIAVESFAYRSLSVPQRCRVALWYLIEFQKSIFMQTANM